MPENFLSKTRPKEKRGTNLSVQQSCHHYNFCIEKKTSAFFSLLLLHSQFHFNSIRFISFAFIRSIESNRQKIHYGYRLRHCRPPVRFLFQVRRRGGIRGKGAYFYTRPKGRPGIHRQECLRDWSGNHPRGKCCCCCQAQGQERNRQQQQQCFLMKQGRENKERNKQEPGVLCSLLLAVRLVEQRTVHCWMDASLSKKQTRFAGIFQQGGACACNNWVRWVQWRWMRDAATPKKRTFSFFLSCCSAAKMMHLQSIGREMTNQTKNQRIDRTDCWHNDVSIVESFYIPIPQDMQTAVLVGTRSTEQRRKIGILRFTTLHYTGVCYAVTFCWRFTEGSLCFSLLSFSRYQSSECSNTRSHWPLRFTLELFSFF